MSRATIGDWKQQGCPIDGDIGDVARWKVQRDIRRAGAAEGDLPELIAEHARRLFDLERRIESVNSLPTETGSIKAAIVYALLLERALLYLPGRIIAAGPNKAPECFYRAVFESLNENQDGGPS